MSANELHPDLAALFAAGDTLIPEVSNVGLHAVGRPLMDCFTGSLAVGRPLMNCFTGTNHVLLPAVSP